MAASYVRATGGVIPDSVRNAAGVTRLMQSEARDAGFSLRNASDASEFMSETRRQMGVGRDGGG